MTLRECIDKIEQVDVDDNPTEVYEELFELVSDYDRDLAYELTEDYCYDDWIVDLVHDTSDLDEIKRMVEDIDTGYGIYYDCGYHEFENADMGQLKDNILSHLNNLLDDEDDEDDENEEEDDSAEVEWIEEDDDFLTKEVK